MGGRSILLTPVRSAEPTLFSAADFARVAAFFEGRPALAPTPLVPLPNLAKRLEVGRVLVKDETGRFGLNAFKLLGARFAVETLMAEGRLHAGETLVCASEGNHGRAVAHTARQLGCPARVYLSHAVAEPRAQAIASEGATVVRVRGTYDDAVRQAAADAQAYGWQVISDTSWDGYEDVPRLIMLGYTRLVDEIAAVMPAGWVPDAIFVPGGVGGLLAAVAMASARRWRGVPRVVAVEPASAACLQASARAGRPTAVPGPFDTMMGGLRCGEVSPLAFEAARPLVSAYIAVHDGWAEDAMRQLARPSGDDPVLRVGPSGAAALAGLLAALADERADEWRSALGLTRSADVVLIASEGVTDPPLWRRVVGDA